MAANTANLSDPVAALDLNNIRTSLMRMEDSIIFSLIERAQFKRNLAVYEADCMQLGEFKVHTLKQAGSNGCLGDWFIYQTECLHSQVRRYLHPTEFPFFSPLPEPTLGSTSGSTACNILEPVPPEALVNNQLLDIYRTRIVPTLCQEGDDGNHGSTAVQDVHVLQTLSTRCYFGLLVAESKFRSDYDQAVELIKNQDRDGLMAFITKPEVEAKNIQRVILKARTFSQDIPAAEQGQLAPVASLATKYKVNPEFIGDVYRDFLMPLTREVEVEYLLRRSTERPSPTGVKRKLEG